ncbi:MAG: TolC family protein [Treponema sp.]|nr:TolC family protein [Treponema sp.]
MKKLFLIFAFLPILASTLFSQSQTKSITLDEAIKLALENNFSIKREEISVAAGKRAASHVWNELLPSLSISLNEEILPPYYAAANNASGIQHNFSFQGNIALSISSDFFASIKKAKLDYEAKKISCEEAVLDVIAQIKESYFSLILAKQNLDFLKENLENAKSQAAQNEERYRRGTLSELEYLSSKVSYEKLKPEFKAFQLAFENDIKNFSLFLGQENKVIPEGSLENFIVTYTTYFTEEKMSSILDAVKNGNIPSLLNLKKQIEAAQQNVLTTQLAAYGLSANLSYGISPVIAGEDKGQINHSGSIGISLPLENFLPFSKGADSIQAAKDSVADLNLQLSEKSKTVKAEYTHIIQSLSQKEESITSLISFVNLAQKNYEATKFAYSKGMTEFLSMQNAAKENLEAKMNLQNELLETLKLYILLEKLYGGK